VSAVAQTNEQSGSAVASRAEERRALSIACGAHALHDGYTDLLYVMLPLWQAQFGIGYAALGLLRTCMSGTMAGFQIPSALLSERIGLPVTLAVGTTLSGIGYLVAGGSTGFWTLVLSLLIVGLGSSTQHPLASALIARAFAGPRSMKMLGTYNFAGDIGKMSVPALASLMLVLLPWQPVVALLGLAGLAAGAAIYRLAPRLPALVAADKKAAPDGRAGTGSQFGFPASR
jgi:FSR family fosmidomycin resistance protein-like MFS transporter